MDEEKRRVKVIISPDRSGPYLELLGKHLRADGVRVMTVPWFGKQALFSWAKLIWGRARGYHLLHINWMPFNGMGLQRATIGLCRALGLEVVWTIHNLVPHKVQFGSSKVDIEGMRAMHRWAREGVVHSERTAEEYRRHYGADLPLTIIPHGSYAGLVKTIDQATARKAIGLPDGMIVVLFFGPNRRNKGVEEFMDVVSMLPEGYLGVIAGGCRDPKLRRIIEERVGQEPHRFRADLRFLSSEEAAEYYGASDVFFMPFRDITTSGTVLEALSFGKAIVVPDKGDMYMLVENGENGYLVDGKEEMAARLGSIDRNTAARMGKRSLEIAKRYSWSDTARSYEQVYERVLRHGKGGGRTR